ncbi:MAG TPA: carboxypeptidase regulatory-like domain-containing protein [Lacipirellulaceae bacterium]|nr:carboxypeptidase regulatory-like domain-containing protein [Lacipirellulaceae bacterium]
MRYFTFCCVLFSLWFAAGFLAANEVNSTAAPKISVAGQVVDPDGKPIAGARVVLREWAVARASEKFGEDQLKDILAETNSDDQGRFRFDALASRPFRGLRDSNPWDVVAFVDGYALGWEHLLAAETDRELIVKLHPAKTIAGRLVDEAGKPISNCKVEVANLSPPESDWHNGPNAPQCVSLWWSQLCPVATTDADGRFEISALPADYRIDAVLRHPKYAHDAVFIATTAQEQPPVPYPGGANGEMQEKPVYMPGFTHALKAGGRIRGQVVYADTGKPSADAFIRLSGSGFATKTDSDGRFELASLALKQYEIYASHDDAGYLNARATVDCTPQNPEHDLALSLPRGEPVLGIVADATTGAGVEGVRVIYVEQGATGIGGLSMTNSVRSGDAGRFEIFVPPGPGELRVYGDWSDRLPGYDVPDYYRWQTNQSIGAGHSTKINVTAGQTLEGVRLAVGRGLVVRGHVMDDDAQPVFGAVVKLHDKYGFKQNERSTVTDDEGRFEFAGLSPHEEQKLEILDVDRALRASAAIPADPNSAAERVVDLGAVKLQATGTITGTVLGDGKPLEGATVYLIAQVTRDGRQEYETSPHRAETDSEGRFRFEAVHAGARYSAMVQRDGYTDSGTTSQLVAAGETTVFKPVELKLRGTFVAGIVVDPDGKPVAGVTVSAQQRNGGSISYGRRGPPKLTDAAGRFRIEDLPNEPLELMAYIRASETTKDRSIHFPAHANAEPGQTNVRIVLDPKLQRPLP